MNRFLAPITLALALCNVSPSTSAAPPPAATITNVTLPVSQWLFLGCCFFNPPFCILQGDLHARFQAEATTGGWEVTALFDPNPVTVSGDLNTDIGGHATGVITLLADTPGSLRADGLRLKGGWKLFVLSDISVDQNGVVSVLAHGIARQTKKNCGSICGD